MQVIIHFQLKQPQWPGEMFKQLIKDDENEHVRS
jgi:hypothetical protein